MIGDHRSSLLRTVRLVLGLVTAVSVVFEIVLFPSFGNFSGGLMMIFCTFLFSAFIREHYIIDTPFSFFMLCSTFLFHYLPVPATLVILRPVSYGMDNPIKTFGLETFMFLIACIAFYLAAKHSNKTGFFRKLWSSLGFYREFSSRTIWILGILGCLGQIYSLSTGQAETGDIIGKALNVLYYYMYTPVVLLFPCLYKADPKEGMNLKNKKVWIYIIFISVLNLATNSRNQLITPFSIISLLFILSLVYCRVEVKKVLSPSKIIKTIVISYFLVTIFTTISDAMLINRVVRSELSFTELVQSTISTIIDDEFSAIKSSYSGASDEVTAYSSGWTEDYLKSTWLNRLSNIRVTDETIYLGNLLSDSTKEKLFTDFINRMIANLPQPVISVFDSTFNKDNYSNSRGDILYVYSGIGDYSNLGGYRVTSHLGDGLTTFGFLYFPLQLIMWYIVMRMLNSFSICSFGRRRVYSLFGLLGAYALMRRFEIADGIMMDTRYVTRAYWQDIILFLCVTFVARLLSSLRVRK